MVCSTTRLCAVEVLNEVVDLKFALALLKAIFFAHPRDPLFYLICNPTIPDFPSNLKEIVEFQELGLLLDEETSLGFNELPGELCDFRL